MSEAKQQLSWKTQDKSLAAKIKEKADAITTTHVREGKTWVVLVWAGTAKEIKALCDAIPILREQGHVSAEFVAHAAMIGVYGPE